MFGRKDKYKSIEPDQPRSEAPTRPNSIQPEKVIKGPDNWFEHGGFVTDKNTANTTNQPHVRIEFDDITDTPKIFIDGVAQESVQHINLTWYKPDMEDDYVHGRYRIEMVDKQRRLRGIGQGK